MDFCPTIFDLDGTLADTMPAHLEAWQQMCARYGFAGAEIDGYARGGVPTHEIARRLIARNGLQLSFEAIAEEKESHVEKLLQNPGGVARIEPVIAIAKALHEKGLPIGIGSGGTRSLVEKTLQIAGISELFRVVVAYEDTVKHKPDPDVFLEVARRLGAPPADCVVYEDSESGFAAARAAGMRFVDARNLRKK